MTQPLDAELEAGLRRMRLRRRLVFGQFTIEQQGLIVFADRRNRCEARRHRVAVAALVWTISQAAISSGACFPRRLNWDGHEEDVADPHGPADFATYGDPPSAGSYETPLIQFTRMSDGVTSQAGLKPQTDPFKRPETLSNARPMVRAVVVGKSC